MTINLEDILREYTQAEPKRAMGGLYALSGFDFQLRLYLAELFEALVKSDALQHAGEVFVEVLSDIAKHDRSQLVLIQAKRTLTPATLKKAAEEVLAIDALLAVKYPTVRPQVCFQVAALNIEKSVSWADLLQGEPKLQPLFDAGRLHPARQEKDPKWRAITALWDKVEKPYELFNAALERTLRRAATIEDAQATRDDICERYTQHRIPPQAEQPPLTVWVDRLPEVEGGFFGREDELAALDEAFFGDDIRVIQFVAAGGTGKTKLLRHWLNQRKDDTPNRIVWSFYSQGAAEDKQISSTPFFTEAFEQLHAEKTRFNSEDEKGKYLATLLIQQRCLLVLDGLEPLQYVGKGMDGRLKDRAIARLLQELADKHSNLCVVTTRIRVKELGDRSSVQEIPLQNLHPKDGIALLKSLGVKGSTDELGKAVREYGFHALALHLLGNAVATYLDKDIRQRDTLTELIGETQYADSERHAFKVMQSYQNWLNGTPELQLLYLLGLFDHPIETAVLDVLWQAKIPNLTQSIDSRAWKPAIENLRSKHRLLSAHEGSATLLDCHPLIREYFGKQLKTKQPKAWEQGHKKLYEYYKALPPKYQPDTLAEMQPLFSAVAHGCAAGLQEKVWVEIVAKRIQRGSKFYLTKILGGVSDELSVFAHFFIMPWRETTPKLNPKMTAGLLGNTGFYLNAMGRLSEALPALQAGLSMWEKQQDWMNASSAAENLALLQLAIGQLTDGIKTTQRAIRHAEQSKNNAFKRLYTKCLYAHALHQTGQTEQAILVFREGERLQSIFQRGSPRLYSAQGYWYNACLLAQGEIGAVRDRAQYALAISEKNNWTPDISLDKLMLGKVYLTQSDYPQATDWLQQAVDGLRSASDQDALLDGLLTRAALYRETAQFSAAHDDLQEVYDLANPSGMRLHLTDYHLESARLALAEGLPATTRTHFNQAEELITATGYHRRDGELAELKSSLLSPI
ncbi:MAG: hypothetical protein PHI11_11375 [Gallionella sp.]|nr:hypothetical protein [Gallionella sp.]